MLEPVALPSSFGRRARITVLVISWALAISVLGLLLGRWDRSVVPASMAVLIGLGFLLNAWLTRRRPALVLDEVGIRRGSGELLTSWSEAALIWVGHDAPRWMGRSMHPFLWVWSAPALDFTRRTGLEPTARVSTSVPTTLRVEEVVDLLRDFATCPVVSGDAVRLRQLVESLRSESQA